MSDQHIKQLSLCGGLVGTLNDYNYEIIAPCDRGFVVQFYFCDRLFAVCRVRLAN